jgi:hypothetical protein
VARIVPTRIADSADSLAQERRSQSRTSLLVAPLYLATEVGFTLLFRLGDFVGLAVDLAVEGVDVLVQVADVAL